VIASIAIFVGIILLFVSALLSAIAMRADALFCGAATIASIAMAGSWHNDANGSIKVKRNNNVVLIVCLRLIDLVFWVTDG
jgi:hypothetical protein